ncbi:30S ribosomal protein S1 [Caldisericum exile]|uniref:30S ribosomal protein S1 n=1 Tax=Caldisericum exile (strain DSM 21853 / NBRC 104410 / AZM16c01) TaxID=511051 RepID=A0A7U6GEJ6_CALEA|nr:S1 RNA-binding domain-containing protein [Caldisericum exile]BAL80920.1 30S ribosomal protein S1 [Caldisericum exile AZM16c01]
MEEKNFYENVNPNDIESILTKAASEKLPQSVKEEVRREETIKEEKPEKINFNENVNNNVQKQNHNQNETFLMKSFKKGDIITVTVVKVDANGAYVNAGTKEDVFIPLKGLTNKQVNSASDVVRVGDKINVMVLRDGPNLVLSKKLADNIKKYEDLKKKMENEEKVKAKVEKLIKGGLLLDIDGVSAFLPQSQVGLKKGESLDSSIGKEIEVYLIEVDPKVKRVIASRLKVLQEEKEQLRKQTLVNLKKGEIYEGTVKAIQDFGVFVDIGNGVEGLIRINELTWGRRKDPHEVVKVGEKIKVRVLSVNLDNEKVSLSLRQTKPHPWEIVEEKYPIGSIVEGTVLRIHPFGVVLELDEGITGLIHISQLDTKRIDKIENFVKIGDKLQAKVMSIDKENRKMKLSRRAILENEQGENQNK